MPVTAVPFIVTAAVQEDSVCQRAEALVPGPIPLRLRVRTRGAGARSPLGGEREQLCTFIELFSGDTLSHAPPSHKARRGRSLIAAIIRAFDGARGREGVSGVRQSDDRR